MTRRISARVAKLENKAGGAKDHWRFAHTQAEVDAVHEWWQASPYSKMPGHRLFVIRSPLPPKDPNL